MGKTLLQQSTEIIIDQIPLGILIFSNHGRVEFINQNFHRLGMVYQFNTSLLNINIFKYNLFPPANIIEDLKDVLKGKSFEREIKNIKTNNGRFISLVAKGSPIYEDENISGGMLIIENLQYQVETVDGSAPESILTDEEVNKEEIFLIVTDINGNIKYSAGKEVPALNLLRKEITGKNINEIFNLSSGEIILKSFKAAHQSGKLQLVKIDVVSGGKSLKYDCRIEPVIGENGLVQIIYLIFNESPIAPEEIKSMVERLHELNYYKEISKKQDTSFIVIDHSGNIINWDEQFAQISNLDKTDPSITITNLFPALGSDKYLEIYQELRENNSCEMITYLVHKTEGELPVSLKFYKGRDSSDEVMVVCTKLKFNSAVIKHENIKSVPVSRDIQNFTQPYCIIDSAGFILESNQRFNNLLGFEDQELDSQNFFDLLIGEESERIINKITGLTEGERKSLPVKLINKFSSAGDFHLIVEAKEFIDEKPYRINCFLTKTEPEAKSPEHVYRSLFKAAKDGMAVELDEKIILANDFFARLFGYEKGKDLENISLVELINESDYPLVREFLKSKRNDKHTRSRLEFIARKKDGANFYAEFFVVELEENEQVFLILIAADITERKRQQEAARDSEQRYKNIAENIEDLLYTFERSGNKILPTYYSAAIEKISGFTQTEFLTDQRLLFKIIHPDDFHDVKKRLTFLLKSDIQSASEFEFRIVNKRGNIVWIRNKMNLIRDEEGKIQKIYGLVSDITFNKRAEEELKQSAANLKKLNDAKDRFLSIISHDLRAPFSSILGFTDLLLEDETLTEVEKQQYITYIHDSSKSMLALVNSMLDWTRLQTGRIKFEPEKLNAREIVENSISTISGTAHKKGIEIENLVDPSVNVFGDKNLILQVFNNLLSNAVKFTKLGDRVMISADSSQTSRFISFSVKDTGTGIKAGNIDKLFNIETKFTSEGTAGEKGSGLGLSLVKEIIDKHGGNIEVKSEFGKGTEFIFTLPIASTKILLVDPNARERLFYSKVLINITTDYAVNVVSNGKEALDRIILSPPALVITEHKMPVMSGLNLVQELVNRGFKDTVPVIILTGDIDRAAIQEYEALGVKHIFNKPVNLRNLKDAIEKSLLKRNKY